MNRILETDEKLLAHQSAGWATGDGHVSRGELVVTDRRMLFLPSGWRRRSDFFAEFDLSWDRLASIDVYPVRRAAHVFVNPKPGPPLEPDAWNVQHPPREPRKVQWRFWVPRMHYGRFYQLGLRRAGLAESEPHVWAVTGS